MRLKPYRTKNPLSFSTLDLVLGLVSIILIIVFALAAQPKEKSNQELLSYYIEFKTKPNLLDSDKLTYFNISLNHKREWLTYEANSRLIQFIHRNKHTRNQVVYINKNLIDKSDEIEILIYLSKPNTASHKETKIKISVICGSPTKRVNISNSIDLSINRLYKKITLGELCGW